MSSAERKAANVPVDVAGERLLLRGDRSVFWPARRCLIVADVHLGKAESLRQDGVALPDAVMHHDLRRLTQAIEETGAERLLVLGDLVHDARGLTATMVERVAEWRAQCCVDIALVAGNHDLRVAALPTTWRIVELPLEVHDGPFRFTHERTPGSAFNWHGHEHPVLTLRGRADRLRLPCFVIGRHSGCLPAFSSLAGGAPPVPDEAVRAWVVADGEVLALPAW